MNITPERIFSYADRYTRRQEAAGRGTQCPTLRQAAKRFGCSYDALESAIEEYMGDGYLGIAVAVRCGAGVGELARSEQMIEAYSDTA